MFSRREKSRGSGEDNFNKRKCLPVNKCEQSSVRAGEAHSHRGLVIHSALGPHVGDKTHVCPSPWVKWLSVGPWLTHPLLRSSNLSISHNLSTGTKCK